MGRAPSERRILMARNLAKRWLEAEVRPEHRLTIYYVGKEVRRLPDVLRGFRDAKLKIGSVDPIPDLGITEGFDCVTVWSSNREALLQLASWFESHRYETTGVW